MLVDITVGYAFPWWDFATPGYRETLDLHDMIDSSDDHVKLDVMLRVLIQDIIIILLLVAITTNIYAIWHE